MSDVREALQQTLGDSYRIGRELGGGGMSRVFAATDTALGRDVVVKVLAPELSAAVNVERFQREVQLAARLQHAYIVPLLSAGVASGVPYYTMPLVEGESLRARLDRYGQLPVHETITILRHVAEALIYAHEHGIVHRDIKPENVLITPYHAVVTDFGVAKALDASTATGGALTSAGIALGTPAYMAPEQAAGDPATDHRADIYALGILAYEMLAGRPPFAARSPHATLAAHAVEKPEHVQKLRAALPTPLAELVMACLEKAPADRPQTAREVAEALTELGSGRSTASAARWRRPRSHRTTMSAGVLLALIAFAAAVWLFRPNAAAAREPRLAVLPFDNLGAPEDQYFAEGLAEEVANRLARVSGISIVARSSAARYGASEKTVQEIGRELDVDYVLDGTVRWARSAAGENIVRVTPELVRVSTGTQMWGEPFEAVVSQVFQVQSDIAQRVAAALGTRLTAGASTTLANAGTASVEAQDAYLLGRFYWRKRTAADIRTALQHFERAIALDPRYARAHAGLADAYNVLPVYAPGDMEPRVAHARAEAAARRAVTLDSTLAEAYAALGSALTFTYRYGESTRLLLKALQLDPDYGTARQWYAENLYFFGRLEESIAEARKAVQVDPLMPVYHFVLSRSLFAAGRHREAEAAMRRAIELNPQYAIARVELANQYWLRGNRAAAVEQWKAFAELDPNFSTMREFAERIDDRAARVALLRGRPSGARTMLYALLGERELAFEALEDAVRERSPVVDHLRVSPVFAGMRHDPRFQRALEEVRLSDTQLRIDGLLR